MLDGKRAGHGVYKCGTEEYNGHWLDDKQHGNGRQTWTDGRSYTGHFQEGRFAGCGKMVWQTDKGPMQYEGEYADDVKHGMGLFTWPDGRSYDGEWCRGKRHGRGAYRTARGERKVGHWADDRFIRWEAIQAEEDQVNVMLK